MKVAILGGRGIPACYSGYDTLIEELTLRLVKSNSARVTVYCRNSYYKNKPAVVHGARLVYLPAPRLKAAESLLHSFLSSLHVLLREVDLIYFVDPANAPFVLLLRLFGKRVVVHTNGLGWKRRKWGPVARRYYRFVELLCAWTANALVADNLEMQEYYREHYNKEPTYIAYGANHQAGVDNTIFEEIGIFPKKYLLVVARLEPENNVDFVIHEFTCSKVTMPLVVVGDSPYNSCYLKVLKDLADNRVHLVGRINDQSKLNALYKGAYLYIHGHEVGGTNPSLLRAMDAGTAPLVIDVPFNKSVVADCGFVFSRQSGHLTKMLEFLLKKEDVVNNIGKNAQIRAEKHFSWDVATRLHAQLFQSVVSRN